MPRPEYLSRKMCPVLPKTPQSSSVVCFCLDDAAS
jgi:hypothetical protein